MCGIVGIVSPNQVNQTIFDALTLLQHRGQDAAGMLTCEGYRMSLRKARGLVVEAIRSRHMLRLKGTMGIGHVRYPTAGSDSEAESQPFYVNSPYGIALAHNGNLTNAPQLHKELIEHDRRHLNTDSDSEVLLNVLASKMDALHAPVSEFTPEIFFKSMENLFERCEGGFTACGLIAGVGVFAFRDPHGIRPLVVGSSEDDNGQRSVMFASESVALDRTGFDFVSDVGPGEAIFVDMQGRIHRKVCAPHVGHYPCIFEYVYLARPDSVIDGVSVYATRLRMGQKIAERIRKQFDVNTFDVVVPVPDSGRHAGLEAACSLGLPYREGFVKNRYVGRTFIMPGQEVRKKSIRQKLNVISDEFKGKHVLLVDDSIVRGNTSQEIIQMARDAGASKVTMVSAAPAVRYPNVYGIDMPAHHELIAHQRSDEQVAVAMGADHVVYQTLEDLKDCVRYFNPGLEHFDCSVFDGEYVAGHIDEAYFRHLEQRRSDKAKSTHQHSGEHGSEVCIHNHE